ncbi:hypothetical protein N658DRAFT_559285 [Parathielavia hyrcaniae]|uniref:Chromo domain-containing protein n=1 Tax=Parathielavia hyrcaniae TaxID=113614 RepID=A0AAN6T1N3_9PEZI|nr:hypothetical protein N658DRAFT_559285 [Parathielavia hyrcaniae]
MRLTIARESSAALTADGTIRCLLDMRYPLPARQSSAAIAFARQFAEELARALLAQLGPSPSPSPATNKRPDGATLTDDVTTDSTATNVLLHAALLHRNRIRVCFDLLLHNCQPEIRQQVDESLAQPIHVVIIHESGDGYRIRRSPMLDARVAEQYAGIRELDKSPRPYFQDSLNLPVYDSKIRLEGGLDAFGEVVLAGPSEDGEEWEVDRVCCHRRAGDGILEVLVKWKSGRETWELHSDVALNEAEALDEYERLHGRVT